MSLNIPTFQYGVRSDSPPHISQYKSGGKSQSQGNLRLVQIKIKDDYHAIKTYLHIFFSKIVKMENAMLQKEKRILFSRYDWRKSKKE